MKILILANIDASGEWIGTKSLLSELKKKNKNIDLYLAAYGKSACSLKTNIFNHAVIYNKPLPPPPFRYYRQLLTEFHTNRQTVKKLVSCNGPFDLIVGTDPFWLLPAFSLGLFPKSIFWFHGFRTYYNFNLTNFNLYIFLRKYLERLAFLLSAKIIVPSDFGKKMLARELSVFSRFKKIAVVPYIPRREFFKRFTQAELRSFGTKLGIPQENKVIVFSGIIDPRKGLLELLEGFSELRKQNKNIQLVFVYLSLVSDTSYLSKVRELISRYGLKSSVILLRDFEVNDLTKLYQRADCGILPSTFETYGLFTLEMLLSGRPVFTTKVGAGSKLSGQVDSLFLLPNNSPQSIFNRLKVFFSKSGSWHKKIRHKVNDRFANFDLISPTDKLKKQFCN